MWVNALSPGIAAARHLNRAEYKNTIRDPLGVDFRPAGDCPQDDSGYGFDNIGDVLSVSPVLPEKYLRASEAVVKTAIYGPKKPAGASGWEGRRPDQAQPPRRVYEGQ